MLMNKLVLSLVFMLGTYMPFAMADVSVDRSSTLEKDIVLKDLPKDFKGDIKRLCQKGDRLYALYTIKKEKSEIARFSFFQQAKETIMWTHLPDDLSGPGLLPPDFILCDLNNNKIPDCLLVYHTNEGIGQASENWTRYLTVFVDDNQVDNPIEIAKSDVWINRDIKIDPDKDNNALENCSSDIGPAYQKVACIFLAKQLDITRIYVVSRTSYFKNMGEKVIREQLMMIQLSGNLMNLSKTLSKVDSKDIKDEFKVDVPVDQKEKEKFDIINIKSKKEYDEFLFKLLSSHPVFF